jgi:hypothetical protein
MNKFLVPIVGAIAVLFPLSLLLNVNAGFYVDWYNHLWLIGYYGQYFSVYHRMPLTINTHYLLLLAYPTFYGHLFYSVLGLISSLTGPNLAIRLGFATLWALMFWLIYRVTIEFSQDRLISLTLGCLICWAIYPLTNLYNRSALTEVFATELMVCTLCSALLMIVLPETRSKISYMLLTGFTFALSSEHPITLFFSIVFLGPMLLVMAIAWFKYQKQDIVPLTIIAFVLAIMIFLVLAPWAYAILLFKNQLAVLNSGGSGVDFIGENLFTHFMLFPFDYRSLLAGLNVSTPYLDSQMNVPLLLFLLGFGIGAYTNKSKILSSQNLKQAGKGLFWTATVLFCLAAILSGSHFLYRYIPVLNIIQFPYRAVSYMDISVLAAVLALIMIFQGQFGSSNTRLVVVTFCLTLSFSSLLVKLSHATTIMKVATTGQECNNAPVDLNSNIRVLRACYDLNPVDRSFFLNFPRTFYGEGAYTIDYPGTRASDSPLVEIDFLVGDGKNFGLALPKVINFSAPTWIITNISSSPWTVILIDHSPIPTSDMINARGKLEIKVPVGKHIIEALFSPDRVFLILEKTRSVVLILWVAMAVGWLLFIFVQNLHASIQVRDGKSSNKIGRISKI